MQGDVGGVYLVFGRGLVACVVAVGNGIRHDSSGLPPPPAPSSPNTTIESSAKTMILEGVAEAPYGKETPVFYKTPFRRAAELDVPRKGWISASKSQTNKPGRSS